jgi:hypothetical protein
MAERDRYILGVPCWVDTTQPDPERAVAFYSGLFGWECEDLMPPGAGGHYFVGRIRGEDVGAIGSAPAGAPPQATWNTYIWVESADASARKVRDAGGSVLMEPSDVGDAGRTAVCADPAGAVFCLWEPNAHRGAQIVNEHGSVNFNGLNTRDPEGAQTFYGSVFGWRTLDLGGGRAMWMLPGYGDHLELDRPELRDEQAEVGAPPGFEDVVATVARLGDDQAGTPPYWDVTFAVDDADAVAAKATELGGTVLVAPFDAPWVRMTVITDPQGATFIASTFAPENKDVATSAHAATG